MVYNPSIIEMANIHSINMFLWLQSCNHMQNRHLRGSGPRTDVAPGTRCISMRSCQDVASRMFHKLHDWLFSTHFFIFPWGQPPKKSIIGAKCLGLWILFLSQVFHGSMPLDIVRFHLRWAWWWRRWEEGDGSKPICYHIWVNYNDLTATSLEIMVNKGNHPQMALIQVSEIL